MNPYEVDNGEPEEHDGLDALCEFFCVDRSKPDWESYLSSKVCKNTSCGATVKVDWARRSVVFHSIVEGSDAECTRRISFDAITSDTLTAAIQEIEDETSALWAEANED